MEQIINLEKRVDTLTIIDEETYLRGILDITQFLFDELRVLLDKENRFFGIMISYYNSIDEAFKKLNSNCTEEDCDVYGKILYLFKPQILREYKKLEKRKLSKADSMIVLIKRLIDFVIEENQDEFPYLKQTKTLSKIIDNVYNNIRNNGKKYKTYTLLNQIKYYMTRGFAGKLIVDEFIIMDELSKYENTKKEFIGSRTELNEDDNSKLIEVIWTGE